MTTRTSQYHEDDIPDDYEFPLDPDDCSHPVNCRFGKLALYRGEFDHDDHIRCSQCGSTIQSN